MEVDQTNRTEYGDESLSPRGPLFYRKEQRSESKWRIKFKPAVLSKRQRQGFTLKVTPRKYFHVMSFAFLSILFT